MQYLLESFSACCAGLNLSSLQHLVARSIPWTPYGTVMLAGRRLYLVKQIGEGGYSFVYQAFEADTGKTFALKKVLIAGPEQSKLARREIEVMQSCQHPNLLPLLESSTETVGGLESPARQALYLLFPLYPRGSLYEEITTKSLFGRPLRAAEVLQIFRQVCAGVQAMHSHTPALSHRDIKPHNVLLRERERDQQGYPTSSEPSDTDGSELQPLQQEMRQQGGSIHAVLMDFGSTREARVEIRTRAEAIQLQEEAEAHSSAPYRAPELFDVASHCSLDQRVDVWSLGCLLYFMMYAVSPFERVLGEAGGSLALAVQNGHVKWPDRDEYSQDMRDLIHSCLTLNPVQRPFVTAILAKVDELLEDLT